MKYDRTKNIEQQKGQSMVEMLIALPLLLMLIFGILQWGFISRAKVTFNTATELAARAGSLNSGAKNAITKAFEDGMVPLFMKADASFLGMVRASAAAKKAFRVNRQGRLTILNPSTQVWTNFKESVFDPKEGTSTDEIPADNLMFRPSTQTTLSDDVKMNIQDANLLKIRMDWCQELIVPVIGELFVRWVSDITAVASAEQLYCDGVATATGKTMLAMRSTATYRMQTPFRNE